MKKKNLKKPFEHVRIAWGVSEISDGIGNAYGYSVHNKTLKKYVEKIANITEDAEDIVIIISPEQFKYKVEGKRNWLFTMFEGTDLPEPYVEGIGRADFLLTPSTWVKSLFERYFDKEKIFVIYHGVEKHFTFKKRKYPLNRPFRYLWVGAPNPRKGYEEIIVVWANTGFISDYTAELYIKTTRVDGLHRKGNVILDGRNLTRSELVNLYHSAHCFVFPTRGEGFGLTLAEAMRTGLPCIATNYSGVTDFFDEEVGYVVGYDMKEAEIRFVKDDKKYKTLIAYPDVVELAEKMIYVRSNYKEALLKGEKASHRICTYFTWEKSAEKLVRLIESKS